MWSSSESVAKFGAMKMYLLSSMSFMVLLLYLGQSPFTVHFCILCEVGFQLHSFAHGCLSFPMLFVEETVHVIE